jgi:poly[(R)-3-hydroxyalkanoate] polymerase subunit PhaC
LLQIYEEDMATERLPAAEGAANEQLNLAEQAAESMLGPNPFIGLRLEDIVASFKAIGRQAVQDPKLLIEQEAALIRDLISVMAGQSALAPPKGDKRFVDPAWQTSPFYRMVLQGYVAWTNALQGFVDRTALDDRTKERARFAVSLVTDALAPTNTLLGNPVALKKTWDTRGREPRGWTEEPHR